MPAPDNSLIISYLTLRKAIGVLGLALPFVLVLGALLIFRTGPQPSISDYYFTGMRDVFVGTLFVTGFFLFCYKGYGRLDDIVGDVAGIFALGVALFPTQAEGDHSHCALVIGRIHLACAALFFLALAFFCLYLFTRSDGRPTAMKLVRNRVYRSCGWTIIGAISFIVIWFLLLKSRLPDLDAWHPVLILETIAEIAFGVSWLVKGRTLLKD